MVYFMLVVLLVVTGFLMRNVYADIRYRQYKKEGIRVYEDHVTSHKVSRIIFAVLLAGTVYLIIRVYTSGEEVPAVTLFSLLSLALLCSMYTFVPYSNAKWVITRDGIFLYNFNTFIPWSEMVGVSVFGASKKVYLQLELLKDSGDKLKRRYYPAMIPADQSKETRDMIREFIELEDKERVRLHKQRLVKPEQQESYSNPADWKK